MIPLFKPHIDSSTRKAAADALDLGWLGMGSYVKAFEEKLAQYLELPERYRLVAVNTCTSALHLALLTSGVKPGDEVITPALNNIGDFQAIGMCGAQPVFVDICEDDLGINPELIDSMIGPKVKAIIALHYSGLPCRIEGIHDVARKYGLRVIEDAAHAVGSRRHGKMIGSYGDITCYSFDAIKTLTCIDGGAIVVPCSEEAERLYPARLLGMTQSNDRLYSNSRAYRFDVLEQGFRYHLANPHAAIGLSQLEKLPEFISNRRRYCIIYNELLQDIQEIATPKTNFDDVSMFNYVIRVKHRRRSDLMEYLKQNEIETGIHWVPGHCLTWLKNSRGAGSLSVTDTAGTEIMTLPLWSYMPHEIIYTITNAIRIFFGYRIIRYEKL